MEIFVVLVVYGFRMVLYALCLALASVSFRGIWQTSVVHRNLRCVLLAQNAAIAAFSVLSEADSVIQLWRGEYFYTQPMLISPISFFGQFLVLIGHVLLIERVLATVFAEHYEKHWTRPYFTCAWMAILTVVSLLGTCVSFGDNDGTYGTKVATSLCTNILVLALCFIEIFIMLKLGLYNASKYSLTKFYARRKHTLSERYQLSENVRTIRQLGPVFIAHFLFSAEVVFSLVVQYLAPSNSYSEQLIALLFVGIGYWTGLCFLVILIAVIQFHPVLRGKYQKMVSKLKTLTNWGRKKNRVHNMNDLAMRINCQSPLENNASPLKEAETLPNNNNKNDQEKRKSYIAQLNKEGEQYFQMLRQQWA